MGEAKRKRRILLVEDLPIDQESLERALIDQDYEVVTVQSSRQAANLLAKSNRNPRNANYIHLAVVDVHSSPDTTFLAQMRTADRQLRIVLYGNGENRDNLTSCISDEYVEKGQGSIAKLVETIQQLAPSNYGSRTQGASN